MIDFKEKKERLTKFITYDMWRLEPAGKAYRFAVRSLRLIVMVAHGFTQDNCFLRATALAYTTIFSIIPAMAVIFGLMGAIAPLQRYEEQILNFVLDQIVPGPIEESDGNSNAGQHGNSNTGAAAGRTSSGTSPLPVGDIDPAEERGAPEARDGTTPENDPEQEVPVEDIRVNLRQWIARATQMLEEFSAAIGSIGVVILIFAVISLLAEIERAFNAIWGVKEGRRYLSKVIYYWAAISFVPLFVIISLAGAATLLGSEEIMALREWPLIRAIVESRSIAFMLTIFTPFLFMWITFMALYFFMPNTSVRLKSAAFGAFWAAALFELLKWGQFSLNERFIRFSILFGSLAAVPVFLMWIYFIWVIALFGCEIAFASQNIRTYGRERRAKNINQAAKESIALRMMALASRRFVQGKSPLSEQEIADWFDIPIRLVRDLSHRLHQAGLLMTIEDGELRFHPARSLETIRPKDVIECIREGEELDLRGEMRPEDRFITDLYIEGEKAADKIYASTSFAEIMKNIENQQHFKASRSDRSQES